MKFENAPLIELVAELRWGTPSVVPVHPVPGVPLAHAHLLSEHDTMANSFGRIVASAGYTLTERVFQGGGIQVPFQATHRFRRSDITPGASLFSLGVGLFSANITPPYKTWESFRPVVELGVDALLKSRIGDAVKQPFAVASLRYVNAFHSNLTQGKGASEFLEMLGFRISLPPSVNAKMDKSRPIKPMLLLSIPLAENRVMHISTGDATVNGQEAVLMDNVVTSRDVVAPTVEAVMAEFDSARMIIHDVFVNSTKPIEDLLSPIEEAE
ncbi:Uncharacterised protein [Burkholderia pseudomallei]|nr:Uncharacterised protein [Burkholderia pseudomallei]